MLIYCVILKLLHTLLNVAHFMYSLHMTLLSFARYGPQSQQNQQNPVTEVTLMSTLGIHTGQELPPGAVMIPMNFLDDNMDERVNHNKSPASYLCLQSNKIRIIVHNLFSELKSIFCRATILRLYCPVHSNDGFVTEDSASSPVKTNLLSRPYGISGPIYRPIVTNGRTATEKRELAQIQRRFKVADSHLFDLMDEQEFRRLTAHTVRGILPI